MIPLDERFLASLASRLMMATPERLPHLVACLPASAIASLRRHHPEAYRLATIDRADRRKRRDLPPYQ